MPKKGKKAAGKGKKGKKGAGKTGKKSDQDSTELDAAPVQLHTASNTGLLDKPAALLRVPLNGERLLDVLTTHKVETKELHNRQLSIRALEQLTAQEVRDLLLVFEVFDSDMDGFLSMKEVRRALRALGFKLTRDEVQLMVNDASQQHGRPTDFNTFLDFVIDRQSDVHDTHDEILQAFTYFDGDKSGKITVANLKELCRDVGVKIPETELKEMIDDADISGDNAVNQEEFLKIMLQTHLFS